MLSGWPFLIVIEAEDFVVIPAKLFLEQLFIIDFEKHAAPARIEIEVAFDSHFQS